MTASALTSGHRGTPVCTPKNTTDPKQLDLTPSEWQIDGLSAPVLILIGDADGTRLEHAVEMFRRLGGGIFGDLAPELPASQLAILPGTSHVGMLERRLDLTDRQGLSRRVKPLAGIAAREAFSVLFL